MALVHPWLLPPTRPRTTPSRPTLTSHHAHQVEAGPGTPGLGQLPPGQRDQDQPDRAR